jgi:hypothetical protein
MTDLIACCADPLRGLSDDKTTAPPDKRDELAPPHSITSSAWA